MVLNINLKVYKFVRDFELKHVTIQAKQEDYLLDSSSRQENLKFILKSFFCPDKELRVSKIETKAKEDSGERLASNKKPEKIGSMISRILTLGLAIKSLVRTPPK